MPHVLYLGEIVFFKSCGEVNTFREDCFFLWWDKYFKLLHNKSLSFVSIYQRNYLASELCSRHFLECLET